MVESLSLLRYAPVSQMQLAFGLAVALLLHLIVLLGKIVSPESWLEARSQHNASNCGPDLKNKDISHLIVLCSTLETNKDRNLLNIICLQIIKNNTGTMPLKRLLL